MSPVYFLLFPEGQTYLKTYKLEPISAVSDHCSPPISLHAHFTSILLYVFSFDSLSTTIHCKSPNLQFGRIRVYDIYQTQKKGNVLEIPVPYIIWLTDIGSFMYSWLPVLNDAQKNGCFQSLTATVDCALSERINKHEWFSRPKRRRRQGRIIQ